ncbi:ATP-binding cassette domain-containing protein [Chloroflexi bacterium TSY]|nr:ATP-binding cassette domain-containing protein [Chloroflexi bacterium TSY]
MALLGATGSGKSSIVNLIPRFYEATQGRVLIDDTDVGVVHFSWIDRFTLLETERTFIFSDFAGSQRENGLI